MKTSIVVIFFLVLFGCGSIVRNVGSGDKKDEWVIIQSIPEKFQGEYTISSLLKEDGSRQLATENTDIATFAVCRDSILPLMFPDAYFVIITIELDSNKVNRIMVLYHTANEPPNNAGHMILSLVDGDVLRMEFENGKNADQDVIGVELVKKSGLRSEWKDL